MIEDLVAWDLSSVSEESTLIIFLACVDKRRCFEPHSCDAPMKNLNRERGRSPPLFLAFILLHSGPP